MVKAKLEAFSMEKRVLLLELQDGTKKWYPASTVINYVKPEMKGKDVFVTLDEKDGKSQVVFIKNLEDMPESANVPKEAFEGVKTPVQAWKDNTKDGYWEAKGKFDIENSERISRQACVNSAIEIVKVCMRDDREYTPEGLTEAVIVVSEKLREYVKNGHNVYI